MAKRTSTPGALTLPTADDRILTTKELLERIPLDRTTIWRMAREGRFPSPIRLTRSRIGWKWSAICAWLAEREQHPVPARQYFGRSVPNLHDNVQPVDG